MLGLEADAIILAVLRRELARLCRELPFLRNYSCPIICYGREGGVGRGLDDGTDNKQASRAFECRPVRGICVHYN